MIRLRLKMKSLIWVLPICHKAYNVATISNVKSCQTSQHVHSFGGNNFK